MDEQELQIIKKLRRNARESIAEISRELNQPSTTVYKKIKEQEGKIIKKYATILDYSKCGCNARIQFAIKSDRTSKEELKRYLMSNPYVNSLFKSSSQYDYFVDAIFRHEMEAEDFIEKLQKKFKITDIKIYHVLDDMKIETFLTK
jgi:DNA-binding Lrp family transcriptional regulator